MKIYMKIISFTLKTGTRSLHSLGQFNSKISPILYGTLCRVLIRLNEIRFMCTFFGYLFIFVYYSILFVGGVRQIFDFFCKSL